MARALSEAHEIQKLSAEYRKSLNDAASALFEGREVVPVPNTNMELRSRGWRVDDNVFFAVELRRNSEAAEVLEALAATGMHFPTRILDSRQGMVMRRMSAIPDSIDRTFDTRVYFYDSQTDSLQAANGIMDIKETDAMLDGNYTGVMRSDLNQLMGEFVDEVHTASDQEKMDFLAELELATQDR